MIARACFAFAVAAAAASAARADVDGEVSVGGGGEVGGGEAGGGLGGGGYAVARGALDARLERAAPPLLERGAHLCGEEERGEEGGGEEPPDTDARGPKEPSCVWFFTGLEPDQIDGVGATLDAEARVALEGEPADGLAFGGEAWAAGAGWRLGVRLDVQPEGSLRDPFWRSGRGIVQRNIRVDVPPMWAIGDAESQLLAMQGHVALGERTARDGGAWRHAGFDRDIAVLGVGYRAPRLTLDFIEIRYLEYGVKTEQYQGTTYGASADVVEVDLARASVRVAPSVSLSGRGGISSPTPVAPFEIRGTTETSTGPSALVPSYWIEARHAADTRSATLGGGSWSRLDPSGHAVDFGWLAAASAAWAGPRLQLRGELQLGHLRRILVGDQAPDAIAPVGTRAWIGRGSLEASLVLQPSLLVSATSWIERSDRDDPRWLTPATGRVETRAGADVSAVWRFERKRRALPPPPPVPYS